MSDATLGQIQALQYRDQAAAEGLLLQFIGQTFPALAPQSVALRPSAVSLNSFNGILTLEDGQRLFFKTHVEPDSIVGEYYNSALLAEAGYPVIRPLYVSTEYGKQFLIYDLIDAPSVFDVARQIEKGENSSEALAALEAAQHHADDQLYQLYCRTLAPQSALDAAKAPVHQLFYHRLAGARYRNFYGADTNLVAQLLDKTWIINGRRYRSTLRELIAAQSVIAPGQAGLSIIGHGDAHNGNIFYREGSLLYFDPAFAGRHHPLLDLAKPLFHNVFASWMYHPAEYAQAHELDAALTDDRVTISLDETLPAVRQMFWKSKVERVLAPFVLELKRRAQLSALSADWRLYLKTALFCCPLLTLNLTDAARFPERVTWRGLAYAVQMGAESEGSDKSLLDRALDGIEAAL